MAKPFIIFHNRIQHDLNAVLEYYLDESGPKLADRFYSAFETAAQKALKNPKHHHFFHKNLRRSPILRFPYHFLYRETSHGIRILVLRHDKRKPNYGLQRK